MSSEQVRRRRPPEKFRLSIDEQENVTIPLDKEGNLDYGAVMRYFRVFVKEWSAEYLAIHYAEALKEQGEEEDETVTARWIQIMEKENKVPVDPKRRWILATLLSIPATSFGLELINRTQGSIEKTLHTILKREHIDLVEHTLLLKQYCTTYSVGKSDAAIIRDVQRCITTLYKEAHLTHTAEKTKTLRLLCDYYILAADIAHQYQYFHEAINLLDTAVFIAEENFLYPQLAHALRQRGGVRLERGEITSFISDFAAAKPDFDGAITDFDQIRGIEKHLSLQTKGAMAGRIGLAYAMVSQTNKEQHFALKQLDVATAAIGVRGDDITTALILDAERCYLDRAAVYIASPMKALRSPVTAREKELGKATQQTKNDSKIRQAYNAFLRTKSFFVSGDYAMATLYAEFAIPFAQDANSRLDFARLNAFYQGLLKTPFGKSDAVADLGIALLKAQQPHLFN